MDLDFDGYAVGGLSVGESDPELFAAVESAEPYLPADKPRYAMGLGQPDQLLELIERGIDMFDCVLPTRVARNGTAYTEDGTLNLRNQKHATDDRPLSENTHPLCEGFSRGYLRHLDQERRNPGSAGCLTLHNLFFYLDLMKRARRAIDTGAFSLFKADFIRRYRAVDK